MSAAGQRPSIGRVLLYTPTAAQAQGDAGPWPAVVTRVWSADSVNLMVMPDMGIPFAMSAVDLVAELPEVAEPRTCFWPPRA